jgi:hypothetical protein
MDLPDEPNIVLKQINDEIASDGESMELELDDDYFPSQGSSIDLGKCVSHLTRVDKGQIRFDLPL